MAEVKKIASIQMLVSLPDTFDYRLEARCKCRSTVICAHDIQGLVEAVNEHAKTCPVARGEER